MKNHIHWKVFSCEVRVLSSLEYISSSYLVHSLGYCTAVSKKLKMHKCYSLPTGHVDVIQKPWAKILVIAQCQLDNTKDCGCALFDPLNMRRDNLMQLGLTKFHPFMGLRFRIYSIIMFAFTFANLKKNPLEHLKWLCKIEHNLASSKLLLTSPFTSRWI